MVDIHSHILPGIDDGSKSMEESVEMLAMAAAAGTTDIVATPHANSEFIFDPVVVKELAAKLASRTTQKITIHTGCDFHLNVDNLQDALNNPAKYTVNGRSYLMVELPDLTSISAMRNVLNRLLETRIAPVITHPERNRSIQGNLKDLELWVRDGCYMQVTAQSLLGDFGQTAQRFAESMMNSDLVHFVASDAHDCINRPPTLAAAFKLVSDRWGRERAETLFMHNPSAVLWGEPIYAVPKPNRKSRFLSFWK
jgi:protein-tyrosine phosphatase